MSPLGGHHERGWNVLNYRTGMMDGFHRSESAADESLAVMRERYPNLAWEIVEAAAWEYPDDAHYHGTPANTDYLTRLNRKAGRDSEKSKAPT